MEVRPPGDDRCDRPLGRAVRPGRGGARDGGFRPRALLGLRGAVEDRATCPAVPPEPRDQPTRRPQAVPRALSARLRTAAPGGPPEATPGAGGVGTAARDRKSTRLNSSHLVISYAVFCLKKKK